MSKINTSKTLTNEWQNKPKMCEEISGRVSNCDPFQAIEKEIILYLLKENLNQLTILKYINGWADSNQSSLEYKTIQQRFGEGTEPESVHSEKEINLENFREDCAFVESMLRKTYDEISKSGTYNELIRVLNVFKDTKRDEVLLEADTKEKQEVFEKLQKEIFNIEQYFCREINECTVETGRIKDEIEDFMLESDMKLNYVDQWQNSKLEMNTLKLEINENTKIKTIKQKLHQCLAETRVHEEMEKIFDEIQKELGIEMAFWRNKYVTDLEAMNNKIQELSEKREQQREATAKLQETYSQRQKKINEFKEYKVKQEEKRKEQARRDAAATRLEAWWRGVMVRRGFGKFRKKKDKKAKKKSTDKKAT